MCQAAHFFTHTLIMAKKKRTQTLDTENFELIVLQNTCITGMFFGTFKEFGTHWQGIQGPGQAKDSLNVAWD